MIQLDSCALVKPFVAAKESADLVEFLRGWRAEMISSQLALTEVVRAVRRSCAIRRNAGCPSAFDGDLHLGSLDAIHLAAAQKLSKWLKPFVTYDRALARAAEHARLPLTQPGY